MHYVPGAVEFTVTVLEILCCLYPLAEDAAAVTNVGTGGATLLSMTFTVALEDDEKLLLLDDELDIPASILEGPWLFPAKIKGIFCKRIQ